MRACPSQLVRETAAFVASLRDSHVSVDAAACKEAAAFLHTLLRGSAHSRQSISHAWCNANGLHPSSSSPHALEWIFLVDTLNFCFWTPRAVEPFTVLYKSTPYTGYWALCAAVNRAIDEQIPITDPHFMTTVDHQTLSHIFRSATSTPIPLLEQRVHVLNQAGHVLETNFNSSVLFLIQSAHASSQKLIQLLVSNFQSYDDSFPFDALSTSESYQLPATEQSRPPKLCFFKRAQILVADIWACFASSNKHHFDDIHQLTMFADYRVPQILVWLNALKYTDSLMSDLKSQLELQSGSRREIEIRACSIHAVELIRNELQLLQSQTVVQQHNPVQINSVLIDFLLWDYATAHKDKLNQVPIHHVKSVYY
ncbi:unnamed protein product [Agarophyton chilense]